MPRGGSSNYTVSGGTEPYTFEWTNENEEIISEEMNLGELTMMLLMPEATSFW
jgi:hypothetical protein